MSFAPSASAGGTLGAGQVADGLVADPHEQPQHDHLRDAQVVVGVALGDEAAAQAHHARPELGGEPGVGAKVGGRHVVSITHYFG